MAKDFLSEQSNIPDCESKSSIYLHIFSAEFFGGLMEKGKNWNESQWLKQFWTLSGLGMMGNVCVLCRNSQVVSPDLTHKLVSLDFLFMDFII